jgi:hypothetical protein
MEMALQTAPYSRVKQIPTEVNLVKQQKDIAKGLLKAESSILENKTKSAWIRARAMREHTL